MQRHPSAQGSSVDHHGGPSAASCRRNLPHVGSWRWSLGLLLHVGSWRWSLNSTTSLVEIPETSENPTHWSFHQQQNGYPNNKETLALQCVYRTHTCGARTVVAHCIILLPFSICDVFTLKWPQLLQILSDFHVSQNNSKCPRDYLCP